MFIQVNRLPDDQKEFLRKRFSDMLEGDGAIKITVNCDRTSEYDMVSRTTNFEIIEMVNGGAPAGKLRNHM
ncbi:hypothetical protein B5Z22_08345 [Bacillus velezensis]|nr:hypothetical protein B5Z20_03480 [Bacillus velezensis]OQV55412.1 hypothetical protein B5Z22_08345 [Bacillus velezensis]OQV60903.1 hypothetical protein B5Z24_08350 [Bacillus velezensis]OQV61970.1 hypothetical protein B5Z23_08335 [Bacillus velezensis]